MYLRGVLIMPANVAYFNSVQYPNQIRKFTNIVTGVKKNFRSYSSFNVRFDSPSGMPGSGAGKGGGGGGSVRESGGRLGEYGAAQEDHYFFNKQKEQLEKMKKKLKSDKPGEMTQKEEK